MWITLHRFPAFPTTFQGWTLYPYTSDSSVLWPSYVLVHLSHRPTFSHLWHLYFQPNREQDESSRKKKKNPRKFSVTTTNTRKIKGDPHVYLGLCLSNWKWRQGEFSETPQIASWITLEFLLSSWNRDGQESCSIHIGWMLKRQLGISSLIDIQNI